MAAKGGGGHEGWLRRDVRTSGVMEMFYILNVVVVMHDFLPLPRLTELHVKK